MNPSEMSDEQLANRLLCMLTLEQMRKAELFDYVCWLEETQQSERVKDCQYLVLASDGFTCWGDTYELAVRRALEHDKELYEAWKADQLIDRELEPEPQPKGIMSEETYDSTQDTLDHIQNVQTNLADFAWKLNLRAAKHDRSKTLFPEKEAFDRLTPKLKTSTYGSPEYKAFLGELGGALKHHYSHNSHHPEHYPDGISGMSLLDIVEMFCDWAAACRRHADGSLEKSIVTNASRFKLPPELASIFQNTRKELGWHP